MKFVKRIVKGEFRLYLDSEGNIGLNAGKSDDHQPWYRLGNWKAFKNEVDQAIDEQRQSSLSSFSLTDLEKEVSERRIKIKSDI